MNEGNRGCPTGVTSRNASNGQREVVSRNALRRHNAPACSPCGFAWPHRYYPGEWHVCALPVGHEGLHMCGNPMHDEERRTTHPANRIIETTSATKEGGR